jgi:hypothetical protein
VEVVVADLERAEILGRALALAYKANPLVEWMFEDDLSQTRLQGLFTSLIVLGIKKGLVLASNAGDGASIWFPPNPGSMEQLSVTASTSQWSGGRRDTALAMLAEGRPLEPHYYLDAVGVIPNHRRQGTASALLAPVLTTCDATGVGAYLENSDPENIGFYGRHGFEEVGPLPMPEGAPLVVSMWRSPHSR